MRYAVIKSSTHAATARVQTINIVVRIDTHVHDLVMDDIYSEMQFLDAFHVVSSETSHVCRMEENENHVIYFFLCKQPS